MLSTMFSEEPAYNGGLPTCDPSCVEQGHSHDDEIQVRVIAASFMDPAEKVRRPSRAESSPSKLFKSTGRRSSRSQVQQACGDDACMDDEPPAASFYDMRLLAVVAFGAVLGLGALLAGGVKPWLLPTSTTTAAIRGAVVDPANYRRLNMLFEGGAETGLPGMPLYHSFRVPSIVSAGDDVLLAFAEGRVNSFSDWGDIDLVLKRSVDNGTSWSDMQQLDGAWDTDAWTNPTALYEAPWKGHHQGRVHLLYNSHKGVLNDILRIQHGDRRTLYTYSDDRGLTWAPKKDLTAVVLPDGMKWDAVGPGSGIQKTQAPHAGLLVIPATGRNVVSDDHGRSWRNERVPRHGEINTGESAVVERDDGQLCRYDRADADHWPLAKRRWVACGNITHFPAPTPQDNLLDPRMQASVLRHGERRQHGIDRILFLGSDSVTSRHRMQVRASHDGGKSWSCSRYLYLQTPPDNMQTVQEAVDGGRGGYSSMTNTDDNEVAALTEVSPLGFHASRSIDFHKFNLAWIHENCDRKERQ
eukprot:TRINITY_DN74231_c0_g1_i1.p1 TRINITY_DN74231_c0_g1~~TRINITY_DN74231_c0_g1_i1.p1  ORF type:complete len:526 (+),score=88.15 TRINITY_DN74231_c0_g1_i1:79-1656(+)